MGYAALSGIRFAAPASTTRAGASDRSSPRLSCGRADQEDHPLRSAAEKAPDILARIERVTKRGDEAVHDGEDGQFDLRRRGHFCPGNVGNRRAAAGPYRYDPSRRFCKMARSRSRKGNRVRGAPRSPNSPPGEAGNSFT